jgi:outer membrane protein TolC
VAALGQEEGNSGPNKQGDQQSDIDSESVKELETDGASSGKDAETQPGRRYELETVVERARTNSDLLEEFEAKRDQAEWKKYRAKWAPAPKIDSLTTIAPVPANADPDRLQRNFDEIGALNIGPFVSHRLDLVVPVYTFGRISRLRELAEVGVDVADLKKREAQLNAIFQAKRAYYSLRLSATFEPMLQEGDQRIAERLQEMEDARDFGEADFDTEDFRKLQIFSAELDTRIVDNQKLEKVATSGLKYLAELDAESVAVDPFEREKDVPEMASYQRYMAAAKEHRPDLAQLEHAVEARKLQVGVQRSKFFPEVFVSAGLRLGWSTEETALQAVCEGGPEPDECEDIPNRFARPDSDPLDRFSIRIGAGLRWNVDPVGQHGQMQQKQAQLRAIKAQRDRARGAVGIEIRKKYQDAADALEKIKINETRLQSARRWRDQLGLSLETSGADMSDMSDAIEPLKAFYQAKAKYFEARYQYLVARAALAQSIGVAELGDVENTDESVQPPAAIPPESDSSPDDN